MKEMPSVRPGDGPRQVRTWWLWAALENDLLPEASGPSCDPPYRGERAFFTNSSPAREALFFAFVTAPVLAGPSEQQVAEFQRG